MNNISFLKEAGGAATVNFNGQEHYFNSNTPADYGVRGNTITITIGRYEYKISLSDSITIDTGTGAALFAGTIAQLKAALKLVFPKAGASATPTDLSAYYTKSEIDIKLSNFTTA